MYTLVQITTSGIFDIVVNIYITYIIDIRTSGEVHTSFANLSASRSLDEGQGVGREEAVRG